MKNASVTLGQQAYITLRARMLAGEWLPGSRLTLRGLADDLGTSVQPVREAVSRLSAEKALVLTPNQGVILPPIDKGLLDDLWSTRILMECEAAQLCAARLSDADFAVLDQLAAIIRVHYPQGFRHEWVTAIQQLALLIGHRSGSIILAEQIETLRLRSAPYYAAAEATPAAPDGEFITFSIRLLDEFIKALKQRDAVNASRLRAADLFTHQHYIYRRLSLE